MSERAFFVPEASGRAAAVVAEVERRTSAELVVAVRRHSGRYAAADHLWGALFSFVTLLLLLFLPQEFPLAAIPVDLVVSYAAAFFVSSNGYWLRRLATLPSTQRRQALDAARACFVESGVSRTRDRSGILLYVSMLERKVVLVPDVGLDAEALTAAAAPTIGRLEAAIGGVPDFPAFLAALGELGPVLEKLCPRREDDVNELSDELAA